MKYVITCLRRIVSAVSFVGDLSGFLSMGCFSHLLGLLELIISLDFWGLARLQNTFPVSTVERQDRKTTSRSILLRSRMYREDVAEAFREIFEEFPFMELSARSHDAEHSIIPAEP